MERDSEGRKKKIIWSDKKNRQQGNLRGEPSMDKNRNPPITSALSVESRTMVLNLRLDVRPMAKES